jgi:hypothetical protein
MTAARSPGAAVMASVSVFLAAGVLLRVVIKCPKQPVMRGQFPGKGLLG